MPVNYNNREKKVVGTTTARPGTIVIAFEVLLKKLKQEKCLEWMSHHGVFETRRICEW